MLLDDVLFKKTSDSSSIYTLHLFLYSDILLAYPGLRPINRVDWEGIFRVYFPEADKEFVWDLRHSINDRSSMLPLFIMSVNWANADIVTEVYSLLELWTLPAQVDALQLLDRRFMDPKVRAIAVHCLEIISDEDLAMYMMQLCQQLKFENYTDSALSRFLIRRSLQNQRVIGHIFFWFLQSEMHNQDIKRRFSVLLQVSSPIFFPPYLHIFWYQVLNYHNPPLSPTILL
jgi:hypothetical protein